MSSISKRVFDVVAAMVLLTLLIPVICLVSMLVLILDGRPIMYFSERMKNTHEGFSLYKFRTMETVLSDYGVSGGDKSARITRLGAFLRRSRLDEMPQLWNILRGDMSFVGPRPPLRVYVERFPVIYEKVLRERPGLTGLATLVFHEHEEKLLQRSQSRQETDIIYMRACIPRKARLDLIYQRRRTFCGDLQILLKTVFRRLPL
jgi:lipopolysaccharide/colanic/teichoic acid biosynthesis glycosyltransferase